MYYLKILLHLKNHLDHFVLKTSHHTIQFHKLELVLRQNANKWDKVELNHQLKRMFQNIKLKLDILKHKNSRTNYEKLPSIKNY